MTHDEMIEVIAAHRDGRDLQWWREHDKTWVDLETCNIERLRWTMASTDVRVKPQPRRVFVPAVMTYTTRDGAQRAFPRDDIIEVVEVVK
jgi:hypothetical protein